MKTNRKESHTMTAGEEIKVEIRPRGISDRAAPRYSWDYYGITKERYKELTDMIRSKEYVSLAASVAHRVTPELDRYIILSITKKLSYEGLKTLWELRTLERMPCGRSDFYGWRRCFYSIFNTEVRKLGG